MGIVRISYLVFCVLTVLWVTKGEMRENTGFRTWNFLCKRFFTKKPPCKVWIFFSKSKLVSWTWCFVLGFFQFFIPRQHFWIWCYMQFSWKMVFNQKLYVGQGYFVLCLLSILKGARWEYIVFRQKPFKRLFTKNWNDIPLYFISEILS